MALLNYMFPGSYSVIEKISYTKGSAIDIVLVIYTDNTKAVALAEKSMFISAGVVPRVKGVLLSSPPDNIVDGDCWIASKEYVDENGPITAKVIVTQEGEGRRYTAIANHDIFFDIQTNKHISILDTEEIVPAQPWADSVLFNQYFSMQEDSNVVANIYTFLKNEISEFSECVEG